MYKIDTSTAVAIEPTPAAPGTPGYFTDGDPASNVPATIVSADWFNQITDEILNVLVAAGITPAKPTRNQLAAAINSLIASGVASNFAGTFKVYAGNPNGHVAGVQGNPGVPTFPTIVWDTSDSIWWVCTTTGNAAAAVWTEIGAAGAWPFWCGSATGTGNAPVLATPSAMTVFNSGIGISWAITASNTGAVSIQVGAFGTFPVRKDSPTGPIALTGGELASGNIASARFDGTFVHLVATDLGTAALANASSGSGTVAAVNGAVTAGRVALFFDAFGTVKDGPAQSSNTGKLAALLGAFTAGHIAVFTDSAGTIGDGGPPGAGGAALYMDQTHDGETVGAGVYLTDTSVSPFTLLLPSTPAKGVCLEFIDAPGSWGYNALTLDRNGHTIMGQAESLVCNVAGEDFRIWFNGADWRLE